MESLCELAEKNKYYTEFRHQCAKDKIGLRLRIKKQKRNRSYIDLIYDPLNPDINQILRWESNVQFNGFKNCENGSLYYRKLGKRQYDPEAAAEYVFSEMSEG